MTPVLITIAVTLIGALIYLNRRKIRTVTASGWKWEFSSGMKAPAVNGNGLTFTITGTAKYLLNYSARKPYLNVKIKSDGEVLPVRAGDPTVTLFFQRKGDDWKAKNGTEFYRWYSKATCGPDGSLQATLDPADWISVYGKPGDRHVAEFDAALNNLSNAGVCFGTSSGRGKGWNGNARVGLVLA